MNNTENKYFKSIKAKVGKYIHKNTTTTTNTITTKYLELIILGH